MYRFHRSIIVQLSRHENDQSFDDCSIQNNISCLLYKNNLIKNPLHPVLLLRHSNYSTENKEIVVDHHRRMNIEEH